MDRPIASLVTRPPFSTLFPIRPKMLAALIGSMQRTGFDVAEPIEVWGDVVLDGHTRLKAAASIALAEVPVAPQEFADEDEALVYAIRRQLERRNLTEKEMDPFIFRAVEVLDERMPEGRPKLTANSLAVNGRSDERTAAEIGTSRSRVEWSRVVIDKGSEELKIDVRDGKISLKRAYLSALAGDRLTPEREGPRYYTVAEWHGLDADERRAALEPADGSKAVFTKQVNERIEWAMHSWNPVTGCDHGCGYCYARVIANRYYDFLAEGERFTPIFLPDRLVAPRNTKVPAEATTKIGLKNVFVCSMSDLFGKWVPQDWIDAVFNEVIAAPQWNFLFLTKFPQRLAEQQWPENAWVGTSVDTQARVANAQRSFAGVKAGIKWLSCEPLLEPLKFDSLEMFDWVVIGGQTAQQPQNPEFNPPWEWIEDLINQARKAGCDVYLKAEPDMRPREYPTGGRAQ